MPVPEAVLSVRTQSVMAAIKKSGNSKKHLHQTSLLADKHNGNTLLPTSRTGPKVVRCRGGGGMVDLNTRENKDIKK